LNEPKLFTFYIAIHWIQAENKNKRELKKNPDKQLFTFYFAIHWRQTEKEKKRAKKTEKIIYTLFCELKIKIKKY
jgi:hypothetical protein